jgi:hypothetical protein
MCYGTILSEKLARAAKSHRCEGCGRVIGEGELHHVQSVAFEGAVGTQRAHVSCVGTAEARRSVDDDGCYIGDFGHQAVKEAGGWRKVLASCRELVKRLRPRRRGVAR